MKKGDYGAFSGKQLLEWGQEAPTTSCDELHRRQSTIKGLNSGRYKSLGGSTELLKAIGNMSLKQIRQESTRCPELNNSGAQNYLRSWFG